MTTSDQLFLTALQKKAKEQAILEHSSPLPEWMRPIASVVGLHYWQALLIASFVGAIPISIFFFPFMYAAVIGQ